VGLVRLTVICVPSTKKSTLLGGLNEYVHVDGSSLVPRATIFSTPSDKGPLRRLPLPWCSLPGVVFFSGGEDYRHGL
jgi:hypothetical protein